MIDIIIITKDEDPHLVRCLASIDNDPLFKIHSINLGDNPRIAETPGSAFNLKLQWCDNPVFTIIDSEDYFLPGALQNLIPFFQHKRFGLIYGASANHNSGKVNDLYQLPLTPEIMYNTNPIRRPVFYNRKVADYLKLFDVQTTFPEFDLNLRMWELFPCICYQTPTIATKTKTNFHPTAIDDLNSIIYESKKRSSKYFYNAGPNLYPDSLLEPLCLPPLSTS